MNYGKFIYFMLGIRKFARKTKSAVILRYEDFFHSSLNQQSSLGIKHSSFTLNQQSFWSIRGNKIFTFGQHPS